MSTTKEAKKAVEQTMQRVLSILETENIEDKFVKTVLLNYDVEYDYRGGRRVRLGQRARQMITVTVNDLIESPERFASILDEITAIDKIEVQNIHFDIENKAELFKKSRELAYQKALEKAKQYAELSNRKIGKVLTISEEVSQDGRVNAYMSNVKVESADFLSDDSSVPTGEQGVTSEIHIVFALE